MVTFLRSRLYLNFWLFVLKGAAAVTLITCACILLSLALIGTHAESGGYMILVPIALVGLSVGSVSAFAGFWLMYFTLRLNPHVKLKPLGLVTGVVFAAAAWRFLYLGGYVGIVNGASPLAFLSFPVLPMVLCVYAFMRLTETHLNETARSATEPARIHGIF